MSKQKVRWLMVCALLAPGQALAGTIDDAAEDWDYFGSAVAVGDFDNDGDGDLAIGVPGELDTAGLQRPVVHVLLSSGGDQLWQVPVEVVDNSVNGDDVIVALATGDFDNNGHDDLAIGLPQRDVNTATDAGVVHVLYGEVGGLNLTHQVWNQDSTPVQDVAESSDHYGCALAAGDFDGDGDDDLAIGIMGENSDAGAVSVLYGSTSGLIGPDDFWTQDTPGISGSAEPGDWLGSSLAAGDFDGDGYADLAVGVSGEDISTSGGLITDAGAVNVLFGTSTGLEGTDNVQLYQGSGGVAGSSISYDRFGAALAAGDFDHSDEDDLAIGIPGKEVGTQTDAGQVYVIYGNTTGLNTGAYDLWHQDVTNMEGIAEPYDNFGASLAAGDLADPFDHTDDLAIGVPGEDITVGGVGMSDAGAVNILYGLGTTGLSVIDDEVWYQEVSGVQDTSDAQDRFGFSLAIGDLDQDGFGDLAVGVPGEHVGAELDAGQVHLFYGTGTGLTDSDRLCDQDAAWP